MASLYDGQGNLVLYEADWLVTKQLDPVHAPWWQAVTLSDAQYPSWRLVYWKYLNPDAGNTDVNVYIVLADEAGFKKDASGNFITDAKGLPRPIHPVVGMDILQENGGQTDLFTKNAQQGIPGEVDFNQTADSSFDPSKGQIGPYKAMVKDTKGGLPSEQMVGMGLPLRHHAGYIGGWQKVLSVGVPVNLVATITPVQIQLGQTATLTWSSLNVSNLTLNGAPVSPSGTQTINPTQIGALTFTLAGTQPDGTPISTTATVTVTPGPNPQPGPDLNAIAAKLRADATAILGAAATISDDLRAQAHALDGK